MCFCEDGGCCCGGGGGGISETAQISNYEHPPRLPGFLQASLQSGGKAAAKMLIKANIWMYVFQLVVMKVSYSVHGLDSVHVRVPAAVTVGSPAVLVCESDLLDEDLYSVKWYKGKHEFFRYTSKEIPSIKIFPKAGININVDHCNASHVVLRGVEPHTSGKFSCEITEAAPSFHTKIVTRDLNVVDLPKGDPRIVDMKPYYGADEFLEVECISNESLPAARLEWLINDRPLGVIQPPSRLEFATLPATTNWSDSSSSSSSSNNSSPTTTSSSKKSSKSSLRQKQLYDVDVDEPAGGSALDSNSLQYHSPEFTVPVAAAVVASAAALSLTTASSQLVSSAPALPSPSAVYSTAPSSSSSSRKSSSGGKKGAPVARYETAISRLKLLLGHEHFYKGKIKVKCIARIFDLYERSALQTADENYPQVRVLSNSDNGVHFSFMSDKDEASSASSSHRLWPSMASRRCWLAVGPWLYASSNGSISKLQDTGQFQWPSIVGSLIVVTIMATAATVAVSSFVPTRLLIALPASILLLAS
ncbi:uncharacterized protein LOC135707415 [Ochlerotatus camptorhynchus]|uniref:uncharacterized protein LOC135707415 n=1 Tax=Ochlerotatus camptorhynchus TaxID=644619 RepID=UPI0031E47F9D